MGVRLFLRAGRHRAERDLPADLVQEARLDLTRGAARLGLAFGLAVGLGGLAQAQALVPNPGLTSLLQPPSLDRSRPLMSPDRSAGTRSGLRPTQPGGATPCERGVAPGGVAPAPSGPSLYGSGSGPGGYGRYMPGAPPAGSPAPSSSPSAPQPGATRTAPADRPLYGGIDRPLWDTGERRPAAPAGSAPGKTASAAQANKTPAATDPAGTGPAQPNALPAPVRDRPLWAESTLSGLPAPLPGPAPAAPGPAAGPGAEAAIGGGYAAAPCTPASPPR